MARFAEQWSSQGAESNGENGGWNRVRGDGPNSGHWPQSDGDWRHRTSTASRSAWQDLRTNWNDWARERHWDVHATEGVTSAGSDWRWTHWNARGQPSSWGRGNGWYDFVADGGETDGAQAAETVALREEVALDPFRGATPESISLPPPIRSSQRQLVFVLGMPKCGTTSLHEAFKSAGFVSVHWALNVGASGYADKRLRLHGEGAEERMIAKLMMRASREGLPPLSYLPPSVNAVAEMNGLFWKDRRRWLVDGEFPQMSLLDDLLHHYPDAYFVLNHRDPKRWVESVDKHNDLRQRLVWADLPGLPRGQGRNDAELIEWVEAHHLRVRRRLGHMRNFLDFDIERDGGVELSNFFNRPTEWGKHNVSRKD